MNRELVAALVGAAFIATSSAAMAHHSTAMFDQENPIELVGIVKDFKFTNPHTFILLEVKGSDGSVTVWTLEGGTPSSLTRDGWTNKSIKPGDALKMKVAPLRSGAPGGSWSAEHTRFPDGKPIVVSH
jgi:Family of unknown function (DUF6152)